jgi:predicted nucleic acid-binding protein
MRSALRRNEPVRVPSATLVELYRGKGTDGAVDRELGRGFAKVVTTGVRTARIAGHLLAAIEAGSEMAVDALVVATAIRLGGGLILTHDPPDLERLAANHPNVRVVPV